MKNSIVILLIQVVVGCGNQDKPATNDGGARIKDTTSILRTDTLSTQVFSKNSFSGDTTIVFSYAPIECGCPQWVELRLKDVKFLEGVERFYLEPVRKELIIANNLWDGEHLPLTIRVFGRFSKDKQIPATYHTKGEPEKARIFWYEKITVISPLSNKSTGK